MSLGTVGARRGDDGSDGEPSRRADGNGARPTAAARDGDEPDAGRSGPPADGPVIGANLNGRPRRLLAGPQLLEASNTSWVRAFLDVRHKLGKGDRLEDDPDIVALRRAARRGDCKLVVSLKWDFKANLDGKDPMRVPRPGSNVERELCEGARRCLAAIGAPVDVVVLGNEPMWETRREDIKVDDPPIVRFTRTVKDHLVRRGGLGDPAYLVGAFNRAHSDGTRNRRFPQFYRRMFELVRADEEIDGIDLHVHYDEFAVAEETLAVAREQVPDGMVTVTEFSPVWRYDRSKDTPIGAFAAGEQFAIDHDLPAGMTAVEYFEHAKRSPRPPEELAAFYDAMPWYNVDHIADVHALFAEFDVSVGTLGFVQGPGMREEDWTGDWLPFHINFLFQPALMRADDGLADTAHPQYIEDYRELAGGAGPVSP